MTLTRNPLFPANKVEQFDDGRGSIGSQRSSKSVRSLGSWRSLRSNQRTAGVVQIRAIDPDISLRSLLAQVRGGPIERITRVGDSLVLGFIYKSSAELFYKFASLGQFIVEGRVIKPEQPEVCIRTNSSEYEKAVQDGARRVLKISRPIHDIDCRLLYSKLNMIKMERAFETVGPIVGVQPMFCRSEVAFLIAFENVETAFKAKRLFELKSELFSLYFGWELVYSVDPTEQGCYIPP